jgi:hypothetical protein
MTLVQKCLLATDIQIGIRIETKQGSRWGLIILIYLEYKSNFEFKHKSEIEYDW